jgi:hypothetical protein
MRTFRQGTAVLEVDFAAVICAASAAPFRICIAGTAVYYLQDDGVGISALTDSVIRPVSFGTDELETLAAGEVVVGIVRCSQ